MITAPRRYGRGALYGIASAALFGASAPIAKRLLPQFDPVFLAGLLYTGAAIGLTIARVLRIGTAGGHARFAPADRWKLAGVVFFGGICGPVLLMLGLTRVSGVAGALLLNLEGVWTVLLAVTVFGDRVNAREAVAIAIVILAATILSYGEGAMQARWTGAAAIAAACLCWGIDNNLMQRLSLTDPVRLVQIKAAVAGPVNLAIGRFGFGARMPGSAAIAGALVLGTFSYGVSIVFDVLALLYLGAAREAAFFATAPFVGAALAVPILHESLRTFDYVAAIAMGFGVVLLVRSRPSAQ